MGWGALRRSTRRSAATVLAGRSARSRSPRAASTCASLKPWRINDALRARLQCTQWLRAAIRRRQSSMVAGSRRETPVYMKAAQCKNSSSTPGLRARVKNKFSSVEALVVHAASRWCRIPPVVSPLVPGALHARVLAQQTLARASAPVRCARVRGGQPLLPPPCPLLRADTPPGGERRDTAARGRWARRVPLPGCAARGYVGNTRRPRAWSSKGNRLW